MANSPRVVTGANQDTTGRTISQDYQAPAYAASITVNPTQQRTTINVGLLTGALTLNLGVGSSTTPPYIGDEIDILFTADSGGTHVVTFGTGCASTGTLSVLASKYGKASGKFNGTVWVISSNASA